MTEGVNVGLPIHKIKNNFQNMIFTIFVVELLLNICGKFPNVFKKQTFNQLHDCQKYTLLNKII